MLLVNSAHFWPNWVSSTLNLPPIQRGGAVRGWGRYPLGGCQLMQPFQVPGQTDQAPLPSRSLQTAQRELPETQHLLDNANPQDY